MKKILYIISFTSIALIFSACGGGSGDSASFKDAETIINIVDCNISTNINNYSVLQSNDVIVKDEDNTTVTTYHDVNNNKLICVSYGSAHIVR